MDLTTVNPGAVHRPVLEKNQGTSAEIVLKLPKKDLPVMPRPGFPLVDIRDVADQHVRAMAPPPLARQAFMYTRDFLSMGEIAEVSRNHLPDRAARMPRRQLPNWLVRLAALFDPVPGGMTVEFGVRRDCDGSRTRTLLGLAPRSNREAMIATASSLLARPRVWRPPQRRNGHCGTP